MKHKHQILEALRAGEPRRSIAFRFGVPIETVSEIHSAAKAAREFARRGVRPEVVYANFCDLLSQRECGLA